MRTNRLCCVVVVLIVCSGCATVSPPNLPGRLEDGRTLLPNGWMLSPAGTSIPLGDFPMGMDISPDGRLAVVVNNGYSAQSVMLVDIAQQKVRQIIPIKKSWLGVCFRADGKGFYVSAGNENAVNEYIMNGDTAVFARAISLWRWEE